jgi:hypothetical protein
MDGSAIRADDAAIRTDGSAINTDGAAVSTDGAAISADGATSADGAAISADGTNCTNATGTQRQQLAPASTSSPGTLVRSSSSSDAAALLPVHHMSLFRQEVGGMAARGRSDEHLPNGEVFIVGIVDILQQWDFSKRVESSLKALRRPSQAGNISAVDPKTFKTRLLEYVSRIVE